MNITFRPFRTLWYIIICAVAVHVFGWNVLIPIGLLSVDLEWKKEYR